MDLGSNDSSIIYEQCNTGRVPHSSRRSSLFRELWMIMLTSSWAVLEDDVPVTLHLTHGSQFDAATMAVTSSAKPPSCSASVPHSLERSKGYLVYAANYSMARILFIFFTSPECLELCWVLKRVEGVFAPWHTQQCCMKMFANWYAAMPHGSICWLTSNKAVLGGRSPKSCKRWKTTQNSELCSSLVY